MYPLRMGSTTLYFDQLWVFLMVSSVVKRTFLDFGWRAHLSMGVRANIQNVFSKVAAVGFPLGFMISLALNR